MFGKITDKIFKGVTFLCCAALCFQVVLVTVTVFCRKVFNYTPIWCESLTLLLLVWVSIIGASLPIRLDTHIRVTLIDYLIKKKGVRCLDIVVDIFSIVYCVVIFKAGLEMTQQVSRTILTGVRISKAYLFASVPAAMVLMLLAFAEKYYLRFKRFKEKEGTDL